MTFQTFLFPLASCLPDTPLASTNKHPQGLPEYFIYSATSFLFCLYPCLPGLPFSSAVRAHHRCSLDPPFPLFFFWIIFPNGFFFAPRFYRPDSLSMRSTSRFYLLDLAPFRCFIFDALEDMEEASFLRSRQGNLVPLLELFLFSLLLFCCYSSIDIFNAQKYFFDPRSSYLYIENFPKSWQPFVKTHL